MTKSVCLIDVDSRIPNLALMRASTYHKQRGDSVKLGYDPLFDAPDLCYASKMFDWTSEPEYMPDCETLKGGPGYDFSARMPLDDSDRIMPDYSLYPNFDYAIGRLTRGCPNRCPWCIVWRADGNEVRHVADLEDFWSGQETVRLLDDNIMADSDEFCRDCEQLSNAGVNVIFEALDIRRVTDETAAALATVKHARYYHFAWDGHSQDDAVMSGFECLTSHGIRPWRIMVYILVGFNSTPEYDMYRIKTVDKLGGQPYACKFDGNDPYQHHLARWCNNKFIFRKTDFDHYEPWVKYRKEHEAIL